MLPPSTGPPRKVILALLGTPEESPMRLALIVASVVCLTTGCVVSKDAYLKKEAKQEKDWLKHLQRLGAVMYKKGEITRSEALSQSNYQNAMEFLKDSGVLTAADIAEKGDKKESKTFSLAGSRIDLEKLRHRLFKFL